MKFLSGTSQAQGQGYPEVWVPDVPRISCPKALSLGCFFLPDFFKLSAYKMGVSMRSFKLQVWGLFKLPFSISGENWSLNEHLRAKFGLK